jgi:hypothetical protein
MSRYQVVGSYKGKDFFFTYGFDRPLSEYFLDKVEVGKDHLWHKNGVDLVGPFGFRNKGCLYGSANNLRQMMIIMGIWNKIPLRHQQAIVLDLPF